MENQQRTYETAVVASLFDELHDSLLLVPHYRRAYQLLNRVLQKCLEQKTSIAGVRFGGTFAKTDYLLKEHTAPRTLRATVNDARVRLRKQRELPDATLADNFLYDLKAISQFVGLVYQVPVPAQLEAQFPRARTIERGELQAEYLRVIVNRWDDTYLYADADELSLGELKVFYGGTSSYAVYKDWDWSCLRPLLRPDCQLNLVRPRAKDGVLYPELIVFEPDYLVDISSVAACFESYGASPLNHLLGKLKPAPNTPATLLGNLAGQFLDETLSQPAAECKYGQSVQTFFKGNALNLLTANVGSDFHAKARGQMANIRYAIGSVLPDVLHSDGMQFDSTEAMVEPSFFSEMLGIQGRMDFMQLDQKVVIEQKSGKGGFPPRDPDTPVYQTKHYVQLLLYMLLIRYNNRQQYEQNRRSLHAFLLYSKYRNGLIDLGFAPALVFAAISMRNAIAASEFGYTRGQIDILTRLTADALNTEHTTGVLWERYQKPQLEALLHPIQAASPLERAYYLRFLTFIETEHLMAKIGNQSKENAGFADKWHSSLDDKLLAGNIFCDMQLLSPSATQEGRIEQVVLGFASRPDSDVSNFRTGDIVVLYPYAENDEPDARRSMVFRATIAEIGEDRLVLNLRSSQSNSSVFWHGGQRRWAVEHDFFESSFAPLYRGLHAFLSAPQECRDLLLLQREPQCDKTLALRGDYGAFNELALRVRQAQDLFLIIGPPGTGKTSYGLMNTLQEELRTPHSSVLLLSYTNRAVDEMCSKLVEAGIDFVRFGGRFSCEACYRPYLFDALVGRCQNATQLKQRISQTCVFVGTTTAFNGSVNFFQLKQFALAIIDEASQILEPHLLGLLSAVGPDGTCAIKKVVMIGDHKQLPAVVQQKEEESRVDDAQLCSIGLANCRLSLFERLLKRYHNNPDVVYMLTRQGRMHRDIAMYPNQAFYQNRLQLVPCPHQDVALPRRGVGDDGLADMLATRRIAFVHVPPPQQSASDKVNVSEAQAIAATVVRIYQQNRDTFSSEQTVGVIVPYRNQIAEVRKAIEKSGIGVLRTITIDTVERYQGSQRDYILYGFTVQKLYQLDFLTSNVFVEDGALIDRKLNVAMTRAREHLLLFGNAALLSNNVTFSQLMDFVRSRQGYFDVPLADYVQGHFIVPPMLS